MTRTRRLAGAATLGGALLIGLVGCGGDDPGRAADDPSTPAASSASPTTTSSDPSSPTSATSPATPTVAPATGIELTEATSSVRAPEGWTTLPAQIDYASAATERGKLNTLQLVDSGDISGGAPLDVQAQSALHTLPKGAKASRLPDVELDGVPAFHIHYTVPGDPQEYDTITTVRNGRNVGLDFMLERKSAATNPDLIGSVLATFRWIA